MPVIRIVDIQHDSERVELEDLTQTGLGILIYDCEQLLENLKDAYDNIED
jgi:hypothetical protein